MSYATNRELRPGRIRFAGISPRALLGGGEGGSTTDENVEDGDFEVIDEEESK